METVSLEMSGHRCKGRCTSADTGSPCRGGGGGGGEGGRSERKNRGWHSHTFLLHSEVYSRLPPNLNQRQEMGGILPRVWLPTSSASVPICDLHPPPQEVASYAADPRCSLPQAAPYMTGLGVCSSCRSVASSALIGRVGGTGPGVVLRAWLHSGAYSPDKKAVVEKAVDTLKEKKKKVTPVKAVDVPKPSLARRIWDTVVHSYHGFRLLALDIKVAFRLFWKIIRGRQLTRRESKQLRRTLGDIFRVVPFSVFIIIPFMEVLLPVYLWFFPNALPSTFQTSSSREARKKKELKVKLQMAEFLQGTIEEMAVAGKNPKKRETVQEFAEFFEKIRTSGEQASNEEIVQFSKLFEDELTLDNLSRPQLLALCRLLLLQPYGSSNFLRFQLRMKLRNLEADDKLIQQEGIDNLTAQELQAACQARGMRALGVPVERLKSQLEQWLDLHLEQQIPSSLLLLSRALYLPEHVPTADALQETLSQLPDNVVGEAEVMVADTVGESVDNKARIKVIRQQEELIKEEAQEKEKEKMEQQAAASAEATRAASEEMKDTAPVVTSTGVVEEQPVVMATAEENITAEELQELSNAVSSLKGERSLEDERIRLEELKEDREEYVEDVADLEVESEDKEIQESKGSVRLGRRVDAMIGKIDRALHQVGSDYVETEDALEKFQQKQESRSDVITTEQLEAALTALRGTSCDAKTRSLIAVIDEDHDGNINLEEVAEVIESLALEGTDIKPDHIAQIKELIQKEEIVSKPEKEKMQA